MDDLKPLFENNREWVQSRLASDPEFFKKLSVQSPQYLWIGCSDSRVPANQIVGLMPGEVFVHRNVANLVVNTDINALSVIQYAVETLKIKHIIVCGHYNCGGVHAACGNHQQHGVIDNWLRNIKDIYRRHQDELDSISSETVRLDRLCELNVVEQVRNVCHTTIVQNAWDKGQELSVHGLIYDLRNGLLEDLSVRIDNTDQLAGIYQMRGQDNKKIRVVA